MYDRKRSNEHAFLSGIQHLRHALFEYEQLDKIYLNKLIGGH